ncbi:MAG TPA: hypothetical protein VJH03_18800 [Blastocatellia bacterium]|nr:hypothetical protein [Blastocatellia bacterium]
MFELKRISVEAIPRALEKAERYRLLGEPSAAESICLDILQADADNQPALIALLLALTDRFGRGYAVSETQIHDVLARITDDYKRAYYSGIVLERRAKAQLKKGVPGGGFDAYEWLCEAMDWYEKAEALRPAGNDDAILRWNTCARVIMRNNLVARPVDVSEHFLE